MGGPEVPWYHPSGEIFIYNSINISIKYYKYIYYQIGYIYGYV